MVLKPFKLNILILLLSETREITAVLLTASTKFHIGKHSDSNLAYIIDTIVLCILFCTGLSYLIFTKTQF